MTTGETVDQELGFGPDGPTHGWNAIQDAVLSVALRTSGDGGWEWSARCILRLRGREIPGYARVVEDLGTIWFAPHESSLLPDLRNLSGARARIDSVPGFDADWSISRATISKSRLAAFGDRVVLRFRRVQFAHSTSPGPAALYRIIYRGLRLPHYTHQYWIHNATGAHVSYFTFLDVLGRRFILSEVVRSTETSAAYLGVSFAGPYLSRSELDALELVLFYVAGTGAIRQVVETFDRDARWFFRSFERHGHAQAEYPRPLFSRDAFGTQEAYRDIAAMIEVAKDLIERGFPLRAILFHVFAAEQRVPEMKLTHLAIALDAAKSAMIEVVRGEGKVIEDQRVFEQRIAPAMDALEREFCSEGDAEALTLFKRRLAGANDWSERERWRRFWRDVVHYELTQEERDVLEHRHVAIHVGYILKTEYDLQRDDDLELDRRPYEERLRELVHDADVFRNIVDRVLLEILRYAGAFVDATDPARTVAMRSPQAEVAQGEGAEFV